MKCGEKVCLGGRRVADGAARHSPPLHPSLARVARVARRGALPAVHVGDDRLVHLAVAVVLRGREEGGGARRRAAATPTATPPPPPPRPPPPPLAPRPRCRARTPSRRPRRTRRRRGRRRRRRLTEGAGRRARVRVAVWGDPRHRRGPRPPSLDAPMARMTMEKSLASMVVCGEGGEAGDWRKRLAASRLQRARPGFRSARATRTASAASSRGLACRPQQTQRGGGRRAGAMGGAAARRAACDKIGKPRRPQAAPARAIGWAAATSHS